MGFEILKWHNGQLIDILENKLTGYVWTMVYKHTDDFKTITSPIDRV